MLDVENISNKRSDFMTLEKENMTTNANSDLESNKPIPKKFNILGAILVIITLIALSFLAGLYYPKLISLKDTHTNVAIDNNPAPAVKGEPKITTPHIVPGPYVGVSLQDTNQGIQAMTVLPNSPASEIDIRAQDYILQADNNENFTGKDTELSNGYMSFISKVQNSPDGSNLYLKIKRKDEIINKTLKIKYDSSQDRYCLGMLPGNNFSITFPELKLDNLVRGWKIKNFIQNNGIVYIDPSNELVNITIYRINNIFPGGNYMSANKVLESYIRPSMNNYKKLTINSYPALMHTQTEDSIKKTRLFVCGSAPGLTIEVIVSAPINDYPKYEESFNALLDSLTVENLGNSSTNITP